MTDADDHIEAALLAAGALTAREQSAARRREIDDPGFAALAAEWETALAPLASSLPPVAPPEGLLARIEARLDARARFEQLAATLREPEGDWIVIGAGLRCKVVERLPEQGRQTILLEAAPGAFYPAHDHPLQEEIYMISGDLVMDDIELLAGDFHVSQVGSRHADSTTRTGCRCLICQAV